MLLDGRPLAGPEMAKSRVLMMLRAGAGAWATERGRETGEGGSGGGKSGNAADWRAAVG